MVYNYFQNCINESANEINKSYCKFDAGLFEYLGRICKKYAVFSEKPECNIYINCFDCLIKYNLPIVNKGLLIKII